MTSLKGGGWEVSLSASACLLPDYPSSWYEGEVSNSPSCVPLAALRPVVGLAQNGAFIAPLYTHKIAHDAVDYISIRVAATSM